MIDFRLIINILILKFAAMGQRTPEVNKVALTAFKYLIALISATIIS